VIVNFVVNSNGKVERAKVVRGVHPALDVEAIRVIGLLPTAELETRKQQWGVKGKKFLFFPFPSQN